MFSGRAEFDAGHRETREVLSSPEMTTVDPSYAVPNFSTPFKTVVGRGGFNIPALASALL